MSYKNCTFTSTDFSEIMTSFETRMVQFKNNLKKGDDHKTKLRKLNALFKNICTFSLSDGGYDDCEKMYPKLGIKYGLYSPGRRCALRKIHIYITPGFFRTRNAAAAAAMYVHERVHRYQDEKRNLLSVNKDDEYLSDPNEIEAFAWMATFELWTNRIVHLNTKDYILSKKSEAYNICRKYPKIKRLIKKNYKNILRDC